MSKHLTLKIPRRLESPNTWNGRHWRVKHQLSQIWEGEILYGNHWGDGVEGVVLTFDGDGNQTQRVRVTVERQVPSARNFIRDDDNLRFAVKPLLDALKRQGYIRNDSRKWLEHPTPTQSVSEDGKDWTIVTIEPVADVARVTEG
jgi:hypothetical protein